MKNSRKIRPNATGDSHLENLVASIPKLAREAVATVLFKKLCLHYHSIDSTATAFYVKSYREMWDSKPEIGH